MSKQTKDIALNLVDRYPHLATLQSGNSSSFSSALARIAKTESAFSSGSRLNFWQRRIYSSQDICHRELYETGSLSRVTWTLQFRASYLCHPCRRDTDPKPTLTRRAKGDPSKKLLEPEGAKLVEIQTKKYRERLEKERDGDRQSSRAMDKADDSGAPCERLHRSRLPSFSVVIVLGLADLEGHLPRLTGSLDRALLSSALSVAAASTVAISFLLEAFMVLLGLDLDEPGPFWLEELLA
ncbi:hypothetical protein RHSIM_Rhsim11G0102900 [Rhododendron simsii]|uniref:Uncharacterized protein n=1 Tax=Rhododendron simsii TaxID=118357 RepID=A0A834G760_RHOSS|nr:hypothetical protein RHSIM_Rhsim11G0102900 [Rhododendron simsii]